MTGARAASVFGYAVALAFLIIGVVPAGAAKSGDKPAIELVRAGYTELRKKKYQAAIKLFSASFVTGKLKRNEMAKALYYRGIAYRKSNQAPKAISDFSRALWLKGALSKAEREDAVKQRKAAYAEAGTTIVAPSNTKTAVDARSKQARITRAKPPTRNSRVRAKAAPKARAKKKAVAGSWETSTTPILAPARRPKPQKQATSSNPVGTFFSNLFNGGSGGGDAKSNLSRAPHPLPQTTSSVPRSSAWSSTTREPFQTSRSFKTRTLAAKPKRVRRGRYVLQIAALRSQTAADKIRQRLASNHGTILAGRQPVVERRSIGNMGALYYVKVAGFASRSSARPVCRKLRADGLDCLVQTKR